MPSFLDSKVLERSIFLFGEVWTYSAEDIVKKLLEMNKESNVDPINFIINSPGGSTIDMFGIIDTMNLVKAPIHTYVIGIAASAASVIASSGNKRFITENSQFMLHEASAGAFGNIENMKERVKMVDDLNNRYLSILAKNTNKDLETIKRKLKKTDVYMNAKQSVKFGLCDEIITEKEFAKVKLSEKVSCEGKEINKDLKTVHLLQVGSYKNTQYGTLNIDSKMLEKMKSNFESDVRGQQISLDYTHDNDKGEKKAGAWIKGLFIQDNGLYANVEYTPVAREMIKNEEYKYVSAEFVFNYKTQDNKSVDCVLFGGTFTNRPVLKGLDVLKLSENINKNKGKKMKLSEMKADLKATHNLDIDAIQSEMTTIKTKNKEIVGKNTLLETENKDLKAEKEEAETELKKIKEEEIKAGKEAEVKALVDKGIILTAHKERVLAQFESKEKIQEFYKDAPAVLKVKAKGVNSIDEDPNANAKLETIAKEANMTVEEYKKYSKK